MKDKKNILFSLLILLAGVNYFPAQGQKNANHGAVSTNVVFTAQAPNGIVRTIRQYRKDNSWSTSWEGVF